MKFSKKNFGVFLAAGAFVFLLNIFGLNVPVDDKQETNREQINMEYQNTESTVADVMKVHFLDVDQGLAILVQLGDNVLIYDGGESDTSSYVVAYLKEQGITEIDYLISSHYDSDHVSGLIGCLYAFDVKNVIGSNYEHDSKIYDSFMTAVENEGLKMQYPSVETIYEMGEARITIMAPSEIKKDSNANSVAIKLSYGESDFIFTGDADYSSEKDMVQSEIDLDCEVLSVGHHGSASATSKEFLLSTTPEYAVISCGKDNGYGHPHEEVVDLLEVMEIDVFRSDVQGTVLAYSDGKTITWSEEPCNDYSDGN